MSDVTNKTADESTDTKSPTTPPPQATGAPATPSPPPAPPKPAPVEPPRPAAAQPPAPPKKEAAPAPKVAEHDKSISQSVSILIERLDAYKTIMTGQSVSDSGFKAAALDLANVVQRVLREPTEEILNTVWDFFVANKDGVCQESIALQGINVLDPQTRFRVEIVYTLFRKAVNGVDVSDKKLVNTDLVRSRLNCPSLFVFLQQKAARVSAATKSTS